MRVDEAVKLVASGHALKDVVDSLLEQVRGKKKSADDLEFRYEPASVPAYTIAHGVAHGVHGAALGAAGASLYGAFVGKSPEEIAHLARRGAAFGGGAGAVLGAASGAWSSRKANRVGPGHAAALNKAFAGKSGREALERRLALQAMGI